MSQLTIVKAFLAEHGEGATLLSHLRGCRERGVDRFLLSLLSHSDEQLGMAAANLLVDRHPWLKLQRRPVSIEYGCLEQNSELKRESWEEIIAGVHDFVDTYGPDVTAYAPITHFGGLHHLLVQVLQEKGYAEEAVVFARMVNLDQKYGRRELIFVPTYACNLSCSYCYAKGWQKKFGGEASRDNVKKVLDWGVDNSLDLLSLAGGEPTVYGEFTFLIEQAKKRGMKLTMASNMQYTERIAQLLDSEMVEMITAHYDQAYLENSGQHDRYCKNLKALQQKNIPLRIRYTLTSDSNRAEWTRIFELCKKHGVNNIHFAPTFLNYDATNVQAYGLDSSLEHKATTMMAFCDDALAHNLGLVLCKPVPLCLFPEEKLNHYLVHDIIRNGCVAMDDGCSRNITVNPDLTTFPCNGLAKVGPEITDFTSIQEAGTVYQQFIHTLEQKPFLPQCTTCFYYYQGFCQQACLVEKMAVQ